MYDLDKLEYMFYNHLILSGTKMVFTKMWK